MRSAYILLLIAVASFTARGQGAHRLSSSLDSLVRMGIEATMTERWAYAAEIFSRLSAEDPHHPAGPVMEAAVLHLRAEDALLDVDVDAIDSLHAIAESRMAGHTLDDEQGRIALSFIVSSRGIMSIESARDGAWFKSLQFAVKATSLGEDLLERDPTHGDAALAVGTYYYWKSRRVEIISWLPFIEDSREEGLALLRLCAAGGVYQKYAAFGSLGWVLKDAGNIDEGLRWVNEGIRTYPLNRALLRNKASLYEASGDFKAALQVWEDVRRSLGRDDLQGGWAEYDTWIRSAQLAERMEEWDLAEEYLLRASAVEHTLERSTTSRSREVLKERVSAVRAARNTYVRETNRYER